MNKFKKILLSVVVVSALVPLLYVPTASATSVVNCPDQSILGFPAWFNGLKCDVERDPAGNITTTSVNMSQSETKDAKGNVVKGNVNLVWIIVMNIVQWIILAAGYIAVYFIIWAGFKFIMAEGEPDRIKSARNTIANAVIGLIIVIAAVAIVKTIQAAAISGNVV